MAAGAKCKMRRWIHGDLKFERIKTLLLNYNLLNIEIGANIFEITYSGAFSNGFTEISAPNAVFNGESVSVPLAISSSDAKDTSDGVGVRKVKVLYLDFNGKIAETELTLAGTTVVNWNEYPQRIMHVFASDWGSELDAAGNIVLASRGYQQTNQSFTDATLLSLTAGDYDINVNVNGGGAVNITVSIVATDTIATLITKLNAAFVAAPVACTAELVDSKFRITSNAGAGTSTIACTAGTSNDLIAALNTSLSGFSFASAVNGVSYLQITAGANDSDGSAVFLPNGSIAFVQDVTLIPTTRTNEARSLLLKTAWDGCDNNEDPDYDYELYVSSVVAPVERTRLPVDHVAHRVGKLTLYESYIGGAESGWVNLFVVVVDSTKSVRGIDLGGVW